MKTCGTCRLAKPLEEFNKNKRHADGKHWVCRECARAYMMKFRAENRGEINARGRASANRPEAKARRNIWRRANPDKVRRYRLKDKYKITPEERDRMLADQGNCCAICRVTDVPWATDHSHTTHKFRGVLCHSCNKLIGFAYEREDVLRGAIEYLKRTS